MADWDVNALLLRLVEFNTRAANWQRAGGKGGQKPKPIDLPDRRGRGDKAAPAKRSPDEIAQRLRNLGLIPAGVSD